MRPRLSVDDGGMKVLRIGLSVVAGFVVILTSAFVIDHGGSIARALLYSSFLGGIAAGIGARDTPRYGLVAGVFTGSLVFIALQITVISFIYTSSTTAPGAGIGFLFALGLSTAGGLMALVLASLGGVVGGVIYAVVASCYTDQPISDRR